MPSSLPNRADGDGTTHAPDLPLGVRGVLRCPLTEWQIDTVPVAVPAYRTAHLFAGSRPT